MKRLEDPDIAEAPRARAVLAVLTWRELEGKVGLKSLGLRCCRRNFDVPREISLTGLPLGRTLHPVTGVYRRSTVCRVQSA